MITAQKCNPSKYCVTSSWDEYVLYGTVGKLVMCIVRECVTGFFLKIWNTSRHIHAIRITIRSKNMITFWFWWWRFIYNVTKKRQWKYMSMNVCLYPSRSLTFSWDAISSVYHSVSLLIQVDGSDSPTTPLLTSLTAPKPPPPVPPPLPSPDPHHSTQTNRKQKIYVRNNAHPLLCPAWLWRLIFPITRSPERNCNGYPETVHDAGRTRGRHHHRRRAWGMRGGGKGGKKEADCFPGSRHYWNLRPSLLLTRIIGEFWIQMLVIFQ